MSVPFANDYTLRRVADLGQKACAICYKPTACVLVSKNKADFFHVCESHLADTTFSTPQYSEHHQQLNAKKMELETKISGLEKQIEQAQPYAITKFMSGWKKSAKDEKEADKLSALETDKKAAETELATVTSELAKTTVKNYKLDEGMHKLRIQNYVLAKVRAKRQKEMHTPNFFPSVPSGKP